jgi:formylglycine-generating enzyme required for sulfatase activity
MNQWKSAVYALALTVVSASVCQAQSISMSYVTVGNPGNATDPATGSLYGSVAYTYEIGEYDVTDSQYCTFLNDVDPAGANTLGLYVAPSYSEDGIVLNSGSANGSKYSVITGYANMPVVNVDYWDTLRFVNWMNNGEGNASTETGAYTLLGGTPTPSNSSALLANQQHNAGATVWLPSENEWYKAAYYDPQLNGGVGGYYAYATQSNTAPGNTVGGGLNEANYYLNNQYSEPGPNLLSPVGSFTNSQSYYGTYDQSGDVYNLLGTGGSSGDPRIRGGDWVPNSGSLSSSGPENIGPAANYNSTGFRVAAIAVPESSTWGMFVAGAGVLVGFRGRRR